MLVTQHGIYMSCKYSLYASLHVAVVVQQLFSASRMSAIVLKFQTVVRLKQPASLS